MTKARENSDYTGLAADIVAGDTAARAGRKNLIINGSMQISQRGDYTTATGMADLYEVDRWRTGDYVVTATMQHKTGYPYANDKYMRLEATSSATGYMRAYQLYEGSLEGKTITLSAWVKSNSPNARLASYTGAWFTENSQGKHTGGGGWEKLTLTETAGTYATPYLVAGIVGVSHANVSITSGDYMEVANVQLELGSVATDFEHRSYGEELQLCKRYCQELCDGVATETPIGNLNYYNTTALYGTIQLPVEMRASPTGTIADGTLFYVFSNSAGPATLSLAVGAVSSKCIELIATTSARTSGASAFLRTNGNAAASILLTSEL